MITITVYVPPWDVLRNLFPASTDRAIINGETIKDKPAYDHQSYWWPAIEEAIGENRLVTFHSVTSDDYISIGNTGLITYRVFAEWLVKLNWRPYGEQKILKRRNGPHVHSHYPDL